MKKITFLIFSFFVSFSGFAQLTEDFESGTFPPSGWTVETTNADKTWQENPVGINGTGANVPWDYAQNESLISPIFSVPSGASLYFTVSMSYYWSVDPNNNYDFLVSISTDGGTSWSQVWDESALGVFASFTPQDIEVDLSAYAGENNVKIKFNYVGNDGADLDIDDISVQTTIIPPGYCLEGNLFPENTFSPSTCDGATENIIAENSWAGEYSNVQVYASNSYTFSSSVATDLITIASEDGTTPLVYGTGPLNFTPTVDGIVRVYFHLNDNCDTEDVNRIKSMTCTTTATLPDCASNPTPEDGTIGIIVGTPFDLLWTAPTTGGTVVSYNIYSGIDPGTLVFSFNTTDTFFNGVTVPSYATTYYWQVVPVSAAGEAVGCTVWSFTTEDAPAAPSNDECTGAIALATGTVFEDNAVSGTVLSATDDATVTPSCALNNAQNSDVWYTVVVPASGNITIETQESDTNSLTDTTMAIFSGTCGALTEIGCNDDIDGTGGNFMSSVSLTGQTPGATLYVGLWKWGTTAPSATVNEFRISAYDATLANENFDSNTFTVHPNPVKNVLNVSYSDDITSVEVYNLLGQKMLVSKIGATNGQVDMSNLSAGTYMVKITANNLVKTMKIVKE